MSCNALLNNSALTPDRKEELQAMNTAHMVDLYERDVKENSEEKEITEPISDGMNDLKDLKEQVDNGAKRAFILAIDGGGVRGVIPARMLALLEEKIRLEEHKHDLNPIPLGSYFKYIAGTSIGGISALGLITGKTGSQLENILSNDYNLKRIFSPRTVATSKYILILIASCAIAGMTVQYFTPGGLNITKYINELKASLVSGAFASTFNNSMPRLQWGKFFTVGAIGGIINGVGRLSRPNSKWKTEFIVFDRKLVLPVGRDFCVGFLGGFLARMCLSPFSPIVLPDLLGPGPITLTFLKARFSILGFVGLQSFLSGLFNRRFGKAVTDCVANTLLTAPLALFYTEDFVVSSTWMIMRKCAQILIPTAISTAVEYFGSKYKYGLESVFRSQFPHTGLIAVIREQFGDPLNNHLNRSIAEYAIKPVIISYNATQHKEVIFSERHPETVYHVALATSAAPTYFPAHPVAGSALIDGGIFANNPSYFVFREAVQEVKASDIVLISLGTGFCSNSPLQNFEGGLFHWKTLALEIVMDNSTLLTNILMKDLIRGNYIRLQASMPERYDLADISKINELKACVNTDSALLAELQLIAKILVQHKIHNP